MKSEMGYGDGSVNSSARQAWEPQLIFSEHALMSGWCVQSQPLVVRQETGRCSQGVCDLVCFVQGWPTKGWLKVKFCLSSALHAHTVVYLLKPINTQIIQNTNTHGLKSKTKQTRTPGMESHLIHQWAVPGAWWWSFGGL